LEEAKDSLEKWIFWRITNLFNYDLSLIFYDLTSSYFEGNGPSSARYGYSRDHRPDLKQIQIGLLVNPDGIPISHMVFNGAISDQKTLPSIIYEMTKKFNIKRCIFVADDGILTGATIREIKSAGYESILSVGMHKEKWVDNIIKDLPKVDTWQKIKDNLWIYAYPGLIDGFRIVAVFNYKRKEAQKRKRDEHIQESIDYLSSFNQQTKRGAQKDNKKVERQIERFLKHKGTKKFFTFNRKGSYNLVYNTCDGVIKSYEAKDGIMLLRSDAKTLTPEQIAMGYETLVKVEDATSLLKHLIKIRPIRHYNDERVKGHVAVCVLAYLLEAHLETLLEQSKVNLTARKAISKLKSLTCVEFNLEGHTILKTVPPTQEQIDILKSVGLEKFERNICK